MQDFYYIDVVCATGPAQGGRVNRPLIQFVSYTNSKLILAIREDDGTTIGWRYFRAVQYDSDNNTVTIPGALKAAQNYRKMQSISAVQAINIFGFSIPPAQRWGLFTPPTIKFCIYVQE